MPANLTARRVVVTGASQGLGRAISERLLCDGASVLICARTEASLADCFSALRRTHGERVASTIADVRAFADMQRVATEATQRFGGIDGVVCNAGMWGPKGRLEDVELADWYDAVETNVFGIVHTVRAALPALRASGRGRIVVMSGGGATKPMPRLSAYAASKSAAVRLGETLAEELREDGIAVNMVAPGAVNTKMLDELLAAGPEAVGPEQFAAAQQQRANGGTPPERGAALCAWLLSDAAAGITGKLISAVWDPWETLDTRLQDLTDTDIFTLRRIVPSDRGRSW